MGHFKDYYTYNFIRWASFVVLIIAGLLLGLFGAGRLSLMIAVVCWLTAGIVVACSILHDKHNIYFEETNAKIDKYIGKMDVNLMSRMITNITKLTGMDAVESMTENGYIICKTPACLGDREIGNFVSYLSKSISQRYSFRVHPVGVDRYIIIHYTEINKDMLVCLTNLPFGQAISFKPINKAQRLGIKHISESNEEFSVHFANPIASIENVNAFIVCGLVGLVLQSSRENLSNYDIMILGSCSVILLLIFFYNKRKISSFTKLPKGAMDKEVQLDEIKGQAKNNVADFIISRYYEGDESESIKDIFNAHGFIYIENKILVRNDEELDDLIAEMTERFHATDAHKIYDGHGGIGAWIKINGRVISIKLSRLDNTQIIQIA